jgi:hypothetical protein
MKGFAASMTNFPDAEANDPARLGWMVGSPPPTDRIIRFADGSYYHFPALRWSFSNFRQLLCARPTPDGEERDVVHF